MNEGFKNTETSIPEKVPQIKIPTRDPNTLKQQDRILSAIPDSTIGIPLQMTDRERVDAFEVAYGAIVGNEKLERLAVRGINEEKGVFAKLMNQLSKLCLSLSDDQIDDIIRKFNENLRSKATKYDGEYKLNSKSLEDLKTGRKMMGGSVGIKSVVHFVRSRLKLHSAKPETIPAFFFEDYLDSWHDIDLIEMFAQEDGMVMNLIQIKSRNYTPNEIEENTEIHKKWVDRHTIDLNAYEKSLESEPEDPERFKELFTEANQIEDFLMDMITRETMTVDVLFEKMGLKGMPNVERVWVLSRYIDVIKKASIHVEDVGLTEDQSSHIHGIISEIEAKLAVLIEQKNNLKGISEIHSICTVGENQVSDVVIFKPEGRERKAVNIKN